MSTVKTLESCLAEVQEPAQEIRLSFRPDEVERLYNLLRRLGFAQYCNFVREHIVEIHKYIELPASRRAVPDAASPDDLLLIRIASFQVAEIAGELLSEIAWIAYPVNLTSGKDLCADVGAGFASLLLRKKHPLWFFPFDGYDNPFS